MTSSQELFEKCQLKASMHRKQVLEAEMKQVNFENALNACVQQVIAIHNYHVISMFYAEMKHGVTVEIRQ